MTTGDNRIRLDQTPVDDTVRDKTGQEHDSYPAPNTQARFDFMQGYLIGLLSHQSSEEEPFEKHPGMTWFSKKMLKYMAWWEDEFQHLSKFIGVEVENDDEVNVVSIQELASEIMSNMQYVGPRVIWSGVFTNDENNEIPIPEEYQATASIETMHPLVYLNGKLLDPRNTNIRTGDYTTVYINGGVDPMPGDEYTVILEKVTDIKEESVPAGG